MYLSNVIYQVIHRVVLERVRGLLLLDILAND